MILPWSTKRNKTTLANLSTVLIYHCMIKSLESKDNSSGHMNRDVSILGSSRNVAFFFFSFYIQGAHPLHYTHGLLPLILGEVLSTRLTPKDKGFKLQGFEPKRLNPGP